MYPKMLFRVHVFMMCTRKRYFGDMFLYFSRIDSIASILFVSKSWTSGNDGIVYDDIIFKY